LKRVKAHGFKKLKTTAFFVCFVLAVFVSFPGQAFARQDREQDVKELLGFFDKIVFGREFDTGKQSFVIKKWQQPLRVVVRAFDEKIITEADGNEIRSLRQKPVPEKYARLVRKHLQSLTKITKLKIENVKKSKKPANIVINLVPELQLSNPALANVEPRLLAKMAGQGGCYFLSWSGAGNRQIVKSVIVVNKDRLIVKTDHCLLEELTQSLGLPNDINAPWPSIFNNTGRIKTLSWRDEVFLRTLYDPRLRVGMTRAEALKLARKIIAEQLVNAPR